MKRFKVMKTYSDHGFFFKSIKQSYGVFEIDEGIIDKKLFEGSISDCYAYILLAENNYF